jgi:hypothetical protein
LYRAYVGCVSERSRLYITLLRQNHSTWNSTVRTRSSDMPRRTRNHYKQPGALHIRQAYRTCRIGTRYQYKTRPCPTVTPNHTSNHFLQSHQIRTPRLSTTLLAQMTQMLTPTPPFETRVDVEIGFERCIPVRPCLIVDFTESPHEALHVEVSYMSL